MTPAPNYYAECTDLLVGRVVDDFGVMRDLLFVGATAEQIDTAQRELDFYFDGGMFSDFYGAQQ